MVAQINNSNINTISIKKSIKKMTKNSKKIQIKKSIQQKDINQVSMNALYLSDLKTSQNPQEILNILLDPSNNFVVKQISNFNFCAAKVFNQVDFVFDEESCDIVEVNNEFVIEFSFEIKQIQEIPNKYTIVFVNHSQEKDLEFLQMRQQLITKINSN